MTPPVLRPYQQDAISATRQAIALGKRRVLLCAPTGSGKTVIATGIIRAALDKGTRVLFLAHRKELIDQCSARLDECGIHRHGIILQKHHRTFPSEPVQVACVPSLVRRIDSIPKNFGLVIVDECHHVTAKSYQRILDALSDPVVIGLTATPYRADGKGLGKAFDTLIPVTTVPALIEEGFLVPPFVFASPGALGLAGVKTRGGDYAENELARVVDRKTLIGKVVQTWERVAKDRPTIVFAVNRDHSRHLAEEFCAAGHKFIHLDGDTPLAVREDELARLAAHEINGICNVGLFTEGWDCPQVGAVVLARPTKSRGLFKQMAGRGLRPFGSKRDCLILDHADCTRAHGGLTDPDLVSLSAGVTKGNPPKRPCPGCGEPLLGWPSRCPYCQMVLPRAFSAPPEIPEELDVELVPLEPDSAKVRVYVELSHQAYIRGYKPKWVDIQFRRRFGVWPDRSIQAHSPFPTRTTYDKDARRHITQWA